ncbi:SUMF1/EgtB/PvdO family nonheme iron enzyme [Tumidithrix elongata RA019]|uniref:SUMF1/EgtB/PvdO family nonheme iron enzyme n=1 Tax=Tumidithrix elongata BACA0141 TaxID=2716417 RepID=A0AAW9PZG8_9CYAN|nr:SUMF1/EgtB/PvdO family nonheme iron enzyme [Tumidithrix elongata RA019]
MARYGLVVGVAKYKMPLGSLSKTEGDAKAVADLLRQHGDFEDIQVLTGEVTAKQLEDALGRLLTERAERNEALIYYTGHAVVVKGNFGKKRGYFALSNTTLKNGNGAITGIENGIALDDLSGLIGEANLSNLVVLLDCCHSETLLEESQGFLQKAVVTQAFADFKKDYFLVSACRKFEEAYAMRSEAHSIFTGALLRGLASDRANDRGVVNASQMYGYISEQLRGTGQEAVDLGFGGGSIRMVDYRAVVAEKVPEDVCPYVGLEAFTKETAKYFKGRDRFVRLLLQKLNESNFVPVIGASGSGKSSLVRAGLISELEAQGNWLILPPIKPGDFSDNPVMGISWVLAQLCQRADTKREISKAIAAGNLEAAIACLAEPKKILLVVDQFEEIFTVCPVEKEAERQQFIDLLVGITQCPDSRLRVVTTMRADFFENCLGYRGLGEVIQQHQVLLLPMNEAELQEAIAAPAKAGQYELGEGLLTAILRDVRDEKNVLPLLEFALTQLWERRENRRLTFAIYDDLGGVMGALNNHAKLIYDSLKPQEQEWAKRICLMLVRTGIGEKDTRQRQTKKELSKLAKDGDRQDFQMALDRLVAARLLVTGKDGDGDAWVDMAHEALMDKWLYFAKWREEKRDVLRLVNRIRDAFDEWNKALDKDKFLLPEGVVAQIEEVEVAINDYLTPEQQEFVRRNRYKYKPWLDPSNFPEMLDIPSGTVWMGSPDGRGYDDEKPYHQVSVPAFRMGKYPVTQAQWRTVAMSPKIDRDLSLSPSYHRGDDRPVEQITWHEAQEFCARLSKLTGESYRLPSEAEWEYACRAGAKDYTEYCFGDDVSQLVDYAWFGDNSGKSPLDATALWQEFSKESSKYTNKLSANGNRTHNVGGRLPNAWGLCDMHGNVWEWCADDWHDNYEGAPNDSQIWAKDIKNYEDGEKKLLRGGSWDFTSYGCRSAFRGRYVADYRYDNIGFRVVVSVFGSS